MSNTNFISSTSNFKLDSTVSSYFVENDMGTWSWDRFFLYYSTKNPGCQLNEVLYQYKVNLRKISQCKGISNSMRSKAGQLLEDSKNLSEHKIDKASNNVVINGTNYGHININQNSNSRVDENQNDRRKRMKLDVKHTEDTCWRVEDQDDIWDAWRQYMDDCDCHESCLGRMHIIQCGYSIKCNPEIPEELYLHLGTSNHIVENPFSVCPEYVEKVFDAANNNNIGDSGDSHKVLKKTIDEIEFNDDTSKFVQNFLNFIMILFKKNSIAKISKNEAYFNHVLIWPLIEMAVEAVPSNKHVSFIPGEYVLNASQEEYKADAVAINEKHNFEICLLETSGYYQLKDIPRFGYDHVKGCFGVLTMLNTIIKKYNKAKLKSITQLVIPFVHVRDDSIHLWGIELCDRELYAFKKLYKSQVPADWSQKAHVLSIGVLVFMLMKILSKLTDKIEIIAEEHNDFKANELLGLAQEEERVDLITFIDTKIKKPSRGSSYGVLLPNEIDCCSVKYKSVSTL